MWQDIQLGNLFQPSHNTHSLRQCMYDWVDLDVIYIDPDHFFPGRLPPPPSDSSSSPSPVSDPEDFSRTRPKKKSLKNTSIRSRHHHVPTNSKPKGIFAPIPTVPQGFVPYQLTSDSNLFTSSRNKALTMEEGSGIAPPYVCIVFCTPKFCSINYTVLSLFLCIQSNRSLFTSRCGKETICSA